MDRKIFTLKNAYRIEFLASLAFMLWFCVLTASYMLAFFYFPHETKVLPVILVLSAIASLGGAMLSLKLYSSACRKLLADGLKNGETAICADSSKSFFASDIFKPKIYYFIGLLVLAIATALFFSASFQSPQTLIKAMPFVLLFPAGLSFPPVIILSASFGPLAAILFWLVVPVGWLSYLGLAIWGTIRKSWVVFFVFVIFLLLNVGGCASFFEGSWLVEH